jgi:hypothetical protein
LAIMNPINRVSSAIDILVKNACIASMNAIAC